MKKGFLLLSIIVLVAVIGSMFAACAQPAAAPKPATPAASAEPKILKFGALIPMSGPAAAYGDIYKKSLDLYVQIVNETGFKVGQDTYKIQMVYADDKYNPQEAVAAANKVIFSDKVQFIISSSPTNSALTPLTNANKVIFISRNANGFTGYDPKTMPYNVYSNCLNEVSPNYGYVAYNGIPGVKTVGQLYAVGNKGTVDEAIARTKAFMENKGVKLLEPEWYPIGTQDFTPYLSKMHEANIDMLLIYGPATDLLTMAKQRFAAGKKYPIVQTTPVFNLKAFIAAAGADAIEGIVSEYDLPSSFKLTKVSDKQLAMAQKFQDLWQAQYNQQITDITTFPFGWPLLWGTLAVDAVQQAGSTDPDVVMKTVRGGTFDTSIGKLTMTGTKKYGSPVFLGNPCAASIIKGGKEVYLGEIPITDVDNLP
jgi:ABC-type branched-subunit amino acid transport system substrate-binding protein